VIFCGHVHVPALFTCDIRGTVRAHQIPMSKPVPLLRSRRWMGVVGSVGQPRDGDPRASFVTFDGKVVQFHRVAYDFEATMRKIRAIPALPAYLADRLAQGR
jgi:diadenosine tetraphosphatase ApaH/serine/threonine PP2A family protein phosphatase